ncbi:MAG: nucleotide exchange factor GrpE [Alphaproteobacteria bacterium]|nr:nucleotide exchange factor GrpE [Alphaproteobacteria bacterium]
MENKETKVEEVSVNIDGAAASAQPETSPEPAPHPTVTGGDTVQTADCGTQVDSLIAEVKELNDKYLRIAAELENTRRRAALDTESAARRRAMNIASYFLPVMDAADAALSHTPDDEGIKSMARAIEAAFTQIGIVKIDSVGQALNPQFHNAIQVIDADAPANTIIEEMQAGYMFGDAVLRTAMVVVAK